MHDVITFVKFEHGVVTRPPWVSLSQYACRAAVSFSSLAVIMSDNIERLKELVGQLQAKIEKLESQASSKATDAKDSLKQAAHDAKDQVKGAVGVAKESLTPAEHLRIVLMGPPGSGKCQSQNVQYAGRRAVLPGSSRRARMAAMTRVRGCSGATSAQIQGQSGAGQRSGVQSRSPAPADAEPSFARRAAPQSHSSTPAQYSLADCTSCLLQARAPKHPTSRRSTTSAISRRATCSASKSSKVQIWASRPRRSWTKEDSSAMKSWSA